MRPTPAPAKPAAKKRASPSARAGAAPRPARKARATDEAAGTTRRSPVAAGSGTGAAPREEMIRQAAYSFYEQRGCVDGYDLEDWLNAEALVTQRLALDGPDHSPRDDRISE